MGEVKDTSCHRAGDRLAMEQVREGCRGPSGQHTWVAGGAAHQDERPGKGLPLGRTTREDNKLTPAVWCRILLWLSGHRGLFGSLVGCVAPPHLDQSLSLRRCCSFD